MKLSSKIRQVNKPKLKLKSYILETHRNETITFRVACTRVLHQDNIINLQNREKLL